MSHGLRGQPEPAAGTGWHPPNSLLAEYAAGAVDEMVAWSVEAHLESCPDCRAAVSTHVDAERLARNRTVLLALTALPEGGRLWHLTRRCGIPDHIVRLLAATSSLRRSWLLAVISVLAAVTGEALLVRCVWPAAGGAPGAVWHPTAAGLAPFLLVGPILVLVGVAAAFVPVLDPSYRLAVAAPFSGLTLLLIRSVAALVAALVPVVCAAILVPGPSWLPAALLLPSLAICALALAAVTAVNPITAVLTAGALWVGPVAWLALTRSPLAMVQGSGQVLCAVVLVIATSVVFVRRDRLEMGWTR